MGTEKPGLKVKKRTETKNERKEGKKERKEERIEGRKEGGRDNQTIVDWQMYMKKNEPI